MGEEPCCDGDGPCCKPFVDELIEVREGADANDDYPLNWEIETDESHVAYELCEPIDANAAGWYFPVAGADIRIWIVRDEFGFWTDTDNNLLSRFDDLEGDMAERKMDQPETPESMAIEGSEATYLE